MTTPVTRPIPTPGDLARRTPRTTPSPATAQARSRRPQPTPAPGTASPAADLAAPGRLRPDEVLRTLFGHGIRISGMNPNSRLVALTLLGNCGRTGLANRLVSPQQLAEATALDLAQVHVQLQILTQRGWLTTRAAQSGPRQGQMLLQLCVPQAVLLRVRQERADRHG